MTFSLLIQRYGSAVRTLSAIPELAAPGRTSVVSLADVKAELAAFAADDANLIWHDSEVYPARLTQFDDTSVILSTRGNLHNLQQPIIALVSA